MDHLQTQLNFDVGTDVDHLQTKPSFDECWLRPIAESQSAIQWPKYDDSTNILWLIRLYN